MSAGCGPCRAPPSWCSVSAFAYERPQLPGAKPEALSATDFAEANIYCDRGLVWYQKGRYDRAIADFDRAIKLSTSSCSS
jgi:tetratricopeptide (TPR) repeat protein